MTAQHTPRQRVELAAQRLQRTRLTDRELDGAEQILTGWINVLERHGFALADADMLADLPMTAVDLLALRRRRREANDA
jgi:hypothetical protein